MKTFSEQEMLVTMEKMKKLFRFIYRTGNRNNSSPTVKKTINKKTKGQETPEKQEIN